MKIAQLKQLIQSKKEILDEEFDEIFDESVRNHSNRHFSSVFISQKAAEFLVNSPF